MDSEKLEQIKVRSWMIRNYPSEEKYLIHVANEGTGSAKRGMDMKALGLKAGFPDLFLFIPKAQYCGLAIEMKKKKGGKVSIKQNEWIKRLNENYLAIVANGYEEAIENIIKYLNNHNFII